MTCACLIPERPAFTEACFRWVAVRLGALGPRRYAASMPTRRPCPSDLSDARWKLIEPVLSAWRLERRGRAPDFGRPPEDDLRDIMDAILYVDRPGAQ
ncbi:hypothetical protein GCM10010424_73650 [Streptomyces lienomycini]